MCKKVKIKWNLLKLQKQTNYIDNNIKKIRICLNYENE